MRFSIPIHRLLPWALLPMLLACAFANASREFVSYESFGAVGDGKADDLPAIKRAHDHANRHGLPVRSKPDATYHLGRMAITVIIATDTDWGTSRFIIDDSQGVENSSRPLFEVRSLLKPVPLEIKNLRRGQTRLDASLPANCLVYVENNKRRLFIRRGLNQNSGSVQKEVFILRRNGAIVGEIDWDYDAVTRVVAQPIDEDTLFVRGGVFTNIANRMDPAKNPNYWARNIVVTRSRTVIDGVTQNVTGETDVGHPYSGFLSASRCAMVAFRNCVVDGRKHYRKIGSAGKPVTMGTYGYSANLVVDFRMINCRQGNDIHDRSRWGIMGTNFIKNFLIEDCVLSRADVHQGVSGHFTIRRTTLGHAGLNAIGRGRLTIEDSTLHGRNLVSFRQDYGSTWDGEVVIRNSHWKPPVDRNSPAVMFGMHNDGTHDFGYPCTMPRVIRIDGLQVADKDRSGNSRGIVFFGNPHGNARGRVPYPYRITEKIEVRGFQSASGLQPVVSTHAPLVDAVKLVITP